MDDKLMKRSVKIGHLRTSISLEKEFWDSLKEIANEQGQSINTIVSSLRAHSANNLSSSIRLYVLRYYKKYIRQQTIEIPLARYVQQ